MSVKEAMLGGAAASSSSSSATTKQLKYFELSAEPLNGYSAISSPISLSHCQLSSASSSSTSSCGESGIVIMTKSPQHKLSDSAASASTISDRRASMMLNDINMVESLHKLNHPLHEQQQQQQQQQKMHQLSFNEDPRTLQLALELSLVGLNDNQSCYSANSCVAATSQSCDFELAPISHSNHHNSAAASLSGLLMPSAAMEDRSKKSQNMTECVPVPSSEHVAEIVGRQGCKIKALRAKTNTYIKTPVRGEEPVFVVTGRKEDVNKAKREILSAADHFSLIRASRKPAMEGQAQAQHNNGGGGGLAANSGSGTGSGSSASSFNGGNGGGIANRTQSGPPSLPGQITIQVRVPYRVVGLVVGPKGATIKHIQQETQTYIVTPSREKEPIFEVTGLPENVQTARKQIEAHIALRTGNSAQGSENGSESLDLELDLDSHEFATLHTINSLTQILNDDLNPDILSSLYLTKNCISPTLDYVDHAAKSGMEGMSLIGLNNMSHPSCSAHIKSLPMSQAEAAGDKHFPLPMPIAGIDIDMQQQHPAKAHNMFRNTGNSVAGRIVAQQQQQAHSQSQSQSHSQSHSQSQSSASILTRSCSSASSTASTKSTNNSANSTNSVNTPPELLNIWKNLSDSLDVDEGIGDSPSIWNHLPATVASASAATSATNHSPSASASVSPTDSLLGVVCDMTKHKMQLHAKGSGSGSCSGSGSAAYLNPHTQQRAAVPVPPNSDKLLQQTRDCFVCNEKEVTAALVPCGHNMFCMDCANQICVAMEAVCPVCNSIVYHAMRILA